MGIWKNIFGLSNKQETENSVSESMKYCCQSEDADIRKSLAGAITVAWNNMDAELLAPYLADNMQYNSVWVSSTMNSKADYLYYLRRKFETIKISKDVPIVDVVSEYGMDIPSLSQKGTGANSVIDFEENDGKITKMLMRPSIKIAKVDDNEWGTYAKAYQEFLPTAMQIAGQVIQESINERGFKFPDFTWIKTDLMAYPSFHHISFRYGAQVYVILIAIHGFQTPDGQDDDRIIVSKRDYDNLISESEKHNLVPCIIPIAARPQLPMIRNIHLINAVSEEPIILGEPCYGVAMSEWEIYNMGISQVVDYLRKQGSIPIGLRNKDFVIHKELLLKISDYDGYFADLQFANEHNNGDFEDKILWRGDGYWGNFTGLQEIEKAIANNPFIKVSEETVYDIH